MANPQNTPSPRERLREIEASMQGVSEQGFLQRVLDNVQDKKVRAEILTVHQKARARLNRFQTFIRSLVDEHDAIQAEIKSLRHREAELQRSIDAKQIELREVSKEVSALKALREAIRQNERKLIVRNKALEKQMGELTAQRNSAISKARMLRKEALREAEQKSSLQNQLAEAKAEIANLKTTVASKREAHTNALETRSQTIEELRSTVTKLQERQASTEASLLRAEEALRQERAKREIRETQDLAELLQSDVSETEFMEMGQALDHAQSVAQQATQTAENWKRHAQSLSQQLEDMKQTLAEVLRLSQSSAQATRIYDESELTTIGMRLETVLTTMRQLSTDKPSPDQQAAVRHLIEQNKLLTAGLEEATKSASYWQGNATASQAECERLATTVRNLQEQLSQIVASDDEMIRQLLQNKEQP